MTETEKLMALRERLLIRRRALVERFRTIAPEQLTGETFAKLQSAIDAVDRAIEDERRRESAPKSDMQDALARRSTTS